MGMESKTTAAAANPNQEASMSCPACNAKRSTPHATVSGVVTCKRCGAVYTTRAIYRGDSYALVLPQWDAVGACADGAARYYDLELLGSDGLTRSHGWYNPATRRITQTG
jgi:ribosomal protein L37AE/L43A